MVIAPLLDKISKSEVEGEVGKVCNKELKLKKGRKWIILNEGKKRGRKIEDFREN